MDVTENPFPRLLPTARQGESSDMKRGNLYAETKLWTITSAGINEGKEILFLSYEMVKPFPSITALDYLQTTRKVSLRIM